MIKRKRKTSFDRWSLGCALIWKCRTCSLIYKSFMGKTIHGYSAASPSLPPKLLESSHFVTDTGRTRRMHYRQDNYCIHILPPSKFSSSCWQLLHSQTVLKMTMVKNICISQYLVWVQAISCSLLSFFPVWQTDDSQLWPVKYEKNIKNKSKSTSLVAFMCLLAFVV